MAYIQDVQESVPALPEAGNLTSFVVLSQNENGRRLNFKIVGVDIPSGSTATFSGTKPDGVVYSTTGTISGNIVTVNEDIQMTAVAGSWDAKIRVLNGGNVIASAKVRITIDADPVAPGSIPSDSQLDGIVAECQAYAESARSDAYGSPLTASTAAGMIDKTRVYVYTGSETGYTNGHWYYWDGTAWTDGGTYNSSGIQTDTTLSVPGMAADAKAAGDEISDLKEELSSMQTATASDVGKALKAKTVSGGKVTEWEFGEAGGGTAYALPVLYLYGDESEIQTKWQNSDKSKMNFRYVFYNINKNKQKNGWCKLSLQGNATLQYPKHNFNIQFYKDAGYTVKDKVDYMDLTDDKHPKWTLKANYNDYSQGRNVVSARLWGDVVHCRTNMSKALSDAPNHGAIDGHPVTVMMNDAYYGLYMYNMSKSDWMIGIDEDNPMHCAVSSNSPTDNTKWISVGLSGWELEIPDSWQSPEVDGVVTSVQAGFTALQTFVINSTDADFYESLSDYLDVESAIDYLIFSFCVCNADSMNKNQFLVTWDAGKTWSFTAYDMDQTFGAGFTSEIPYTHNLFTTHPNHLFERLIANFYDEIMERYNLLRSSVFSYNYVARELSMFFNEIPSGEREKDKDKNPGIMFQTISTLSKMQEFTLNRLQWCDSFFAKLDPSYVPCTALSLSESSLEFNLLTSQQLTATKTPSDASDPVVWSSSDTSVATVSETGLVTAVADGSATITATCGEQTATCTVLILQIHRGTVDYTIDAAPIATWGTGKAYNKYTGVLEDVTNEHYTEKFHLQDCLYSLTGGSYARLFVWDADGNYQGCTAESGSKVFSARSDWWYAIKAYNGHSNVSLMPIDHSSTEGASKTITVSSVNGNYSSSGHYFYNNTINSQFAGLISSTSGTLNYDAVDWVWADNLVLFKPMLVDATTDSSIEVFINGSGANVEVWLYTQKYTNTTDMNNYLSEHPIMLILNLN